MQARGRHGADEEAQSEHGGDDEALRDGEVEAPDIGHGHEDEDNVHDDVGEGAAEVDVAWCDAVRMRGRVDGPLRSDGIAPEYGETFLLQTEVSSDPIDHE